MKKFTALVVIVLLLQVLPVSGMASKVTRPPLYLFLIGHIEPCLSEPAFKGMTDDLGWFKTIAEKYSAKITALFNGSYVERAVKASKTDILKNLQTSGHEVGLHAHPYIQTGDLK